MERRLAAILAADMVAYSRLVEADEEGTLARQKAHRGEIIDPAIAGHNGRIVKTTGDGLLVEFASAVDAVRCAVEFQRAMAAREAGVPEDRRIAYRIGINLGDIVVEGDDILGDGVNVAARLEGLAEPGGVYLSGTAYDHLKQTVDAGYEYLGERQVKNIVKPVRVYRVLLEPEAAGRVIGEKRSGRPRWQMGAMAAAVLALVAGGGAWWWQAQPDFEPADPENPPLKLPDKPSIAVLPFTNMSGDAEQEYFADGMTEDIITDLSKISGLFVIARNSSFQYKGKSPDLRAVGRELGVKYVLEGSVRRAGNQVRINAQLVDATTGGHLWAERYDGTLANVFALQDQVTRKIVAALKVQLTAADEKTLEHKTRPINLEAYDWLLKGRKQLADLDREKAALAKVFFERAIEADPTYARAYTNLGFFYWNEWRLWGLDKAKSLEMALQIGQKAVELDPRSAGARVLLALAHQFRGEHAEADKWGNEALDLQPTQAETLGNLGAYLRHANRYEEAVEVLKKAMRLDPLHPPPWLSWLGLVYFHLGEPRKAIGVLREGIAREPDYIAFHVFLAASYVAAGDKEKAEAAGREVLRLNSRFTVSAMERFTIGFTKDASSVRRVGAALREAGLPD